MCFTSRAITITVTVYYYVGKISYACQADTERGAIYLVWDCIRAAIETRSPFLSAFEYRWYTYK